MFEKNTPRYLTRGVNDSIPLALQIFMWECIDRMPAPKDYLQVFTLSIENGLQVINHTSEQPEYERKYVLPAIAEPVSEKIFVIDSDEYCTMLLADEY